MLETRNSLRRASDSEARCSAEQSQGDCDANEGKHEPCHRSAVNDVQQTSAGVERAWDQTGRRQRAAVKVSSRVACLPPICSSVKRSGAREVREPMAQQVAPQRVAPQQLAPQRAVPQQLAPAEGACSTSAANVWRSRGKNPDPQIWNRQVDESQVNESQVNGPQDSAAVCSSPFELARAADQAQPAAGAPPRSAERWRQTLRTNQPWFGLALSVGLHLLALTTLALLPDSDEQVASVKAPPLDFQIVTGAREGAASSASSDQEEANLGLQELTEQEKGSSIEEDVVPAVKPERHAPAHARINESAPARVTKPSPAVSKDAVSAETGPTESGTRVVTAGGTDRASSARRAPGKGSHSAVSPTGSPAGAVSPTGSPAGAVSPAGSSAGSRHATQAYLGLLFNRLNRAAHYPVGARRERLQGTVTLKVVIDPDGVIQAVHVKSSSGHRKLDRAATRFLRSLRKVPAPPKSLRWKTRSVTLPIIYRLV